MLEREGAAGGMDTANEKPELVQVIQVIEFGCPAALARIKCKRKITVVRNPRKTGIRIEHQRRYHRNLGIEQEPRKPVLFVDLCFAPAPGPVKLGDNRRFAFDPDLVYPVLIAVQGQHARVAETSGGFDRVDHTIRG